ncbi:MAG: hypothetical protein AB1489_37590, partial [Acidobacteriota bacterium]
MKILLINNGEIEAPLPTLTSSTLIIDVQYAFDTIGAIGRLRADKQDVIKTVLSRNWFSTIRRFLDLAYHHSIDFACKSAKAKIYRELKQRHCSYLSIAGNVFAVADNVTKFRPGDKVAAIGFLQPTLTEYALVHEDLTIKIDHPSPHILRSASALLIGGAAAWVTERCLEHAAYPFGHNLVAEIAKAMINQQHCARTGAEKLLPFSLEYDRCKQPEVNSNNYTIQLPDPWFHDNLNLYSSLA